MPPHADPTGDMTQALSVVRFDPRACAATWATSPYV
jgi:hypothetical protein